MFRSTLTLYALLSLTSCDCEPGPTGPHAFVQNYIISEKGRQPDETTLKRFQSSLKTLPFDELIELVEVIHHSFPESTEATASVTILAGEIWNREPNPFQFHGILGGWGNDDRFNNPFLKHIAKTDPEGGWRIMNACYLTDYEAGNAGFSRGAALPFFEALQNLHPEKARLYFKQVAERPRIETGNLKSHAFSGILAGMSHSEEAISLIHWLREEKLDQRLIGFLDPRTSSQFIKIAPNDLDAQRAIANALTTLTQISPATAEGWLIESKANGSRPKAWANAYLLGICRGTGQNLESAFEFIARHTRPGDGILEDLFNGYFTRTDDQEEQLLKIRAEANR